MRNLGHFTTSTAFYRHTLGVQGGWFACLFCYIRAKSTRNLGLFTTSTVFYRHTLGVQGGLFICIFCYIRAKSTTKLGHFTTSTAFYRHTLGVQGGLFVCLKYEKVRPFHHFHCILQAYSGWFVCLSFLSHSC